MERGLLLRNPAQSIPPFPGQRRLYGLFTRSAWVITGGEGIFRGLCAIGRRPPRQRQIGLYAERRAERQFWAFWRGGGHVLCAVGGELEPVAEVRTWHDIQLRTRVAIKHG